MAPDHPNRPSRQSNESSEDYESDDSMASIKEENEGRKNTPVDKIQRGVKHILSTGSDTMNAIKEKCCMRTENLCGACKKIPFIECLPNDTSEEDNEVNGDTMAREVLIYPKSLSHILKCRNFCKFCRLLFQSVCEPEYDLLKAQHIKEHLPNNDKFKEMKSWIEQDPYLKREWVGGAGLWPFGYAVDRKQSARSTLQQARTLFLEAEDRDINAKSLKMKDLKDMHQSRDMVTDATTAANTSLAIINLSTSGKSENLQKSMAGAQFAMGQLALIQSKKRKRLPCIFMLRAYRKEEKKRGALSVRVYGHGRAPLAPLKEICHFSLRFENSNIPRISKQQIWYGRRLGPQIDIEFFKHCLDACTSKHDCGELLSSSVNKPTSTVAWYEAATFRLIDVHNMCIVKKSFSDMIRSRSNVRYVALSYRWGLPPLMKNWKEYKDDRGQTFYHNEQTNKSTWTRPDSLRLTSDNENAMSYPRSLESEDAHVPKTVQHAIEVVQTMGERYLWVDQLCILQEGNISDKHANIKRMDYIYNHALFTIVAGDSMHADEGLKGLHGHPGRERQLVDNSIVNGARMVLPARMELSFEAWEERAWCLQEKLLSRRILIFANGFAVWHCRGGTWREDVNALDGDKSLVSFPWLRLTPLPSPSHIIARVGLQVMQGDESVRLMRLPSMHQYIEALEDFGRRSIGKSWDVLSAFEGLANILSSPGFLNSPIRMGLPIHYLDVSLLWQSDQPIRRRQDENNSNRCPPSWSWAGWESSQNRSASGCQGVTVRYEQPFDILVLESGIVRRSCKCGEERIRPRKGTFYCVQETDHVRSLKELGLFGMPGMQAKGFKDWDSSQAKPAPKPRGMALERLEERHLVMHAEMMRLQLGDDCWKIQTFTRRAGTEHCIITFHDTRPVETDLEANETTQSDMQIERIMTLEHWINTGAHSRVGVVKFDTAYGANNTNSVTAVLLSEAQYLGNEATPDVLGYPLYNIMLVRTVGRERGVSFMERIGLGKIYKYAWREAMAWKEVIVLE